MITNSFLFHDSSYSGLVSFWVGRETDDQEWIARGVESKDAIEKMIKSASAWNFQNSKLIFLCVKLCCFNCIVI